MTIRRNGEAANRISLNNGNLKGIGEKGRHVTGKTHVTNRLLPTWKILKIFVQSP